MTKNYNNPSRVGRLIRLCEIFVITPAEMANDMGQWLANGNMYSLESKRRIEEDIIALRDYQFEKSL